MKVKTSVSLSQDLVRQIDVLASQYDVNRSALIERAIRDFLTAQAKHKRDVQDLNILNERADDLNKEAVDILSYQVDI